VKKTVRPLVKSKSRSEDVNKANFGSFCAAILSLFFSPYFCPVLQCNNVAYFARSFALYGKMAQWWNNIYVVTTVALCI